MVYNKMSDGQR